jgi:DNA-binding NarL/FixJ family response regulator
VDDSARDKLRILILDDHAVVRRGVRQILAERFEPLEFGEGKAGPEGLDLALGQPWDLVIVAIDVPDHDGLQVLAALRRMRPDQPILVLTVRVHPPDAADFLKADIEGHAEVANNPDELVSAVRRIFAGGTGRHSTIAREALPDVDRYLERNSHEDLSSREHEVLRLIGLGTTVKEIAAVLRLTETTVSTYRRRILIKLGLKSTAELIRYAVINRLAD